jgi:hypothetical protein
MPLKVTYRSLEYKSSPRVTIGTLVYHEDSPDTIIMCTYVLGNYIKGIIVYCSNSSRIGYTVEYNTSRLVKANCRITLEQF